MGTCIISKTKYEELKNDILLNEKEFQRTQSPETALVRKFTWEIRKRLDKLPFDLEPREYEQSIQTFSGIPKVHKNPIKLRPIVNACSCYTTRLAQLINAILKPVLTIINKINPLNIKNTDTYIEKINSIPSNEIKDLRMETLDFQSMYTNIPVDKLINNVRSLLEKYRKDDYTTLNEVKHIITSKNPYEPIFLENSDIIKMITIYLKYNYVKDGETIYKQMNGIPTGGNCSPILANLYLSEYELLFKEQYYSIWQKYQYSGRYLDDLSILTSDPLYSIEWVNDIIYKGDMILTETKDKIDYIPRDKNNSRTIFLDLILELENKIIPPCISYRMYRKPGKLNYLNDKETRTIIHTNNPTYQEHAKTDLLKQNLIE